MIQRSPRQLTTPPSTTVKVTLPPTTKKKCDIECKPGTWKNDEECSCDACMAESKINILQPCIFPFKLGDQIITECTRLRNNPSDKSPWCSTKVNNNGEHIGGDGNWGFCQKECDPCSQTTAEGLSGKKKCIFPFKFKNKLYTSCTTDGTSSTNPYSWCPTETNADGIFTSGNDWGRCPSNCD